MRIIRVIGTHMLTCKAKALDSLVLKFMMHVLGLKMGEISAFIMNYYHRSFHIRWLTFRT